MMMFLISFVSAEWVEGTNIKYKNIETDENIGIEYELKPNEFSFNLTSSNKFDLALCIKNNSNIEFDIYKDGIWKDVDEKKIEFIDSWCDDLDNFGYGKKGEDPDKANYRIRFLNFMSPFKIFAGTGTLISKITLFNFKYFTNEETGEFKMESEELISIKDIIKFKT